MKLCQRQWDGFEHLVVDSWFEAGVLHGFGTRTLSAGSIGASAVEFFQSRGLSLALLKQIHGTQFRLGDERAHAAIDERMPGDAWIIQQNTAMPSSVYAVMTADCFPVLILAREVGLSAAIHAGWRGAVSGILPVVIREFVQRGVSVSALEVAVGPGAQACCYEIQDDVAQAVLSAGGTQCVLRRGEKIFGDIRAVLLRQLYDLGVASHQIVSSEICTMCSARFFSFRREKSQAGRQISFISALTRDDVRPTNYFSEPV